MQSGFFAVASADPTRRALVDPAERVHSYGDVASAAPDVAGQRLDRHGIVAGFSSECLEASGVGGKHASGQQSAVSSRISS